MALFIPQIKNPLETKTELKLGLLIEHLNIDTSEVEPEEYAYYLLWNPVKESQVTLIPDDSSFLPEFEASASLGEPGKQLKIQYNPISSQVLNTTIPTSLSIPGGTPIEFRITQAGQLGEKKKLKVTSDSSVSSPIYVEIYQGLDLKERVEIGTLHLQSTEIKASLKAALTNAAESFNVWEFAFKIDSSVNVIIIEFPTFQDGAPLFDDGLGNWDTFSRISFASSHFKNGIGECYLIKGNSMANQPARVIAKEFQPPGTHQELLLYLIDLYNPRVGVQPKFLVKFYQTSISKVWLRLKHLT